jgi:hypothetical protein
VAQGHCGGGSILGNAVALGGADGRDRYGEVSGGTVASGHDAERLLQEHAIAFDGGGGEDRCGEIFGATVARGHAGEEQPLEDTVAAGCLLSSPISRVLISPTNQKDIRRKWKFSGSSSGSPSPSIGYQSDTSSENGTINEGDEAKPLDKGKKG